MKHLVLILSSALALASCTQFEGSIVVMGDATVYATPDTATLSITVQEEARSTRAALEQVNQKIQTTLATLRAAGLEDKHIQTSNISFRPRQEWDEALRSHRVTGQIVSQSLTVSFEDLTTKPELLGSTLDALAAVDGIQIGNLSFGIKDTNTHYTQARSLAFAKAQQKADELARLAGLSLGKAQSIEEIQSGFDPGIMQANMLRSYESSGQTNSEVPSGQIQIQYTIKAVFETR